MRGTSGRLHRAGVTELEPVGGEHRPTAFAVHGPALDVVVDVRWSEVETPVVTALAELVDFLEHYGPLIQLHNAAQDMDLVAAAARELASVRHEIGGDEEPVHSTYWAVEDVIETGLVVMYARSFTGRA